MFKKILSLTALAFVSVFFFMSQAQAQIISDPQAGLNETVKDVPAFASQTGGNYGPTFLATRAGQIISVVLSFVGVLFFILMIYAGILWMTASGNEQQIGKAKSLLINAIIGIVIVFSAYAITNFLGTQLIQ